MTERQPLFPFSLHPYAAKRQAEGDSEYLNALDSEGRYSNITSLDVWGTVNEDKTLDMVARCSTDNGFCMTSGTFWRKTYTLTDERFQNLIEKELQTRAIHEIDVEEAAKLSARVNTRVAELRAELLKDAK